MLKRPEVACLLNTPEAELPTAYLTAEEEKVTSEDMRLWLEAHGLAGGLKDAKHIKRCYKIFYPVELPEVPEEEHNACLRDLLEFEDNFAITKAEFGQLGDSRFDFKVEVVDEA